MAQHASRAFCSLVFSGLLFFSPDKAVHAQENLNEILKGTYADQTNWGCTFFHQDPYQGPIQQATSQLTTAGEISYDGNGNAKGVGRLTRKDHPVGRGLIGRYECTWVYAVNDDPDLDCTADPPIPDEGPVADMGPIKCDFRYEGSCIVSFGENPPFEAIDQVWYGRIGVLTKNKKESQTQKPPKVLNTDVLFIERHDANRERLEDEPNSQFTVCGKTGTQLKISEEPYLIDE